MNAPAAGLIAAAHAARDALAAEAEANEAARAIGPASASILRSLDAFRMFVPRAYGGPEVDPPDALETIVVLAEADAAAAWCATIASQTSHIAGSIDPHWAEVVFRPADAVVCGAFAPLGRGRRVEGGHVVTGSWSWGSATHLATWIGGGTITDAGEFHQMLFPASAVTFEDTWYAAGLAGTSSNDFSVTEEFVPEGRSVAFGLAKPTCDAPIARVPGFVLFSAGIASIMLGIARRALREIVELSSVKRPAQSTKTLHVSPVVQTEIAKAEASVRAATTYLFHEVGEVWAAVERGDRVSTDQRLAVRLAASHAADECVRAVDTCFRLGGGSAVYARSPLQRCLRDVHTAAAHIMVSSRAYETTGRHLLGLEIDTSSL